MNEIFEKVCKIIRNVCGAEEIEKESFLMVDLGLDSLSLVEVLANAEDEFGVTFDSDKLNPDQLVQVEDIVALIKDSL